jgi:hypothetical protein
MWMWLSSALGIHDRLSDLAQGGEGLFALGLGADAGAVDGQQRRAAQGLGHVRERRRGDEADHGGDVVGDGRRPVAVGAHRLRADIGGEEQGPCVDLGDRQQVDVKGGDDRIAAAAAAQRPEQVGVVVGVDRSLLAVGGDDLDRIEAVAGEPVLAPEPAQPAAEGEADHPDVGRGPRHPAEPMPVGRLAHLQRQHPGLDPGRLRLGVDLDPAHADGPDQDGVVEGRERGGAVAGPLARDPEAGVGGEAHGRDDVLGALDQRQGARIEVGGQVPAMADLVPVGVIRGGHSPRDREVVEVGHSSPS